MPAPGEAAVGLAEVGDAINETVEAPLPIENAKDAEVGETAIGYGNINQKCTSRKAKLLREESSLSSDGDPANLVPTDDTDLNLPPGRMNAVKGTHRLQGSGSNLATLLHSSMSRIGSETPRSRSKSPSLRDRAASLGAIGTGNTYVSTDGNSSISSDDVGSQNTGLGADNDIFTDRAGFTDDMADTVRRMHNSREFLNLPPTVNERMTEDSLEDTHAFSDCQMRTRSSNASLVSGVSSVANEAVLEPLDECEEGLEDSDYDSDSDIAEGGNKADGDGGTKKKKNHHAHPTVILTNMENLNLHHQRILEEDEDDGGFIDNTETNAFIGDDEDEMFEPDFQDGNPAKNEEHDPEETTPNVTSA